MTKVESGESMPINGERFCTNCSRRRKVPGGVWVHSKDGKRRRWKCAECFGKLKTRGVLP